MRLPMIVIKKIIAKILSPCFQARSEGLIIIPISAVIKTKPKLLVAFISVLSNVSKLFLRKIGPIAQHIVVIMQNVIPIVIIACLLLSIPYLI